MRKRELQQLVKLGEDSSRQFKADVTNADSLAAELVAFSNSRGGTILIGVADDGTLVGLSAQDVRRINQLIGNAATQGIRSPISPRTENVPLAKQRTVVAVTVPEGLDKRWTYWMIATRAPSPRLSGCRRGGMHLQTQDVHRYRNALHL